MWLILSAFITKWKWAAIGVGAFFFFGLGFYTRTLLYDAGELSILRKQLSDQIVITNKYHDASEKYQNLNQALIDSNQKITDAADKLPQTSCDGESLPADRLLLLKASRAN